MKRLKAKCKIWLNSTYVEGVFGDGKWRLLQAIDRTGSLSAASESLQISYRKAWGDLNKAQDALNTALVEKQRGGSRGGKTVLTGEGKQWVKAYSKFRTDVEKALRKAYEKRIEDLLK
jgi:molybdate transport system regulatory protein